MLSSNQTSPAKEVTWNFKNNGQIVKVAHYKDQIFNVTNDLFVDRIVMCNYGTTLRIRDLRMEDSGIYKVDFTLLDQTKSHISYNVTIYDPVPTPVINEIEDNDRCIYTLHCTVPSNTSLVSYRWFYRYGNSKYQPYTDGDTAWISMKNETLHKDFLCLVQNPIDKKNVTVIVQSCEREHIK
ncbi:hypothetical protein GDO86_016571, partial [Hymenochirus boettgeri]